MSPMAALKEAALEPREVLLLEQLRADGDVDLGRASAKRWRAACTLIEEGFARWGEGSLLLLARRRR